MMKISRTPLSFAMFAAVFMLSANANAQFVTFNTDFMSIVDYIKSGIEQIKSSSAVVTTTQTVGKISSAIGDAKNAIASVKGQFEGALKEGEKIKKQMEEYKSEYEKYKKFTEEKIEQAKSAKENAERLKALMEDPSALTNSIQDKFTSAAKSYGGELGVPTSEEDLNALKEGAESKLGQGTDLINKGMTAVGGQAVVPQVNMSGAREDTKVNKELKDNVEKEIQTPQNSGFRKGADDREIKGFEKADRINQKAAAEAEEEGEASALEDAEKSILDTKGSFGAKGGAAKDLQKSISDAKASAGAMLDKSTQKDLKGGAAVKNEFSKMKVDTPAARDTNGAALTKDKTAVEKKPAGGFRKSAPLRKESFFNRYTYKLSFASTDHASANGGKATSGDAIIPRDVASFCNLSVSKLKSDYDEILRCLAKIMKSQREVDESSKDGEASMEDITNMRMQNAVESLAIALKMENNGSHEDEVISDLDDKASTLSEGRNLAGMVPTYNMEIAKVIKNYTFVRATRMAFEIFDDMKELDYLDYE